MATLIERPDRGHDPTARRADAPPREHAGRSPWNPRVGVAVAALLTGVSVAIPAAMIGFVYPLNGAQFVLVPQRGPYGEPWVGEIWWPLVFAALALSLGSGRMAWRLAVRSREGSAAGTAPPPATAARAGERRASLSVALLAGALLAFVLAPIMTFYVPVAGANVDAAPQPIKHWMNLERLNFGLGSACILLGLVGMALVVKRLTVSDPRVASQWLVPFTVLAFLLTLVGNGLMFFVFTLIGFWL